MIFPVSIIEFFFAFMLLSLYSEMLVSNHIYLFISLVIVLAKFCLCDKTPEHTWVRRAFYPSIFRAFSPWSVVSTASGCLHGETEDYVWEEKSSRENDIRIQEQDKLFKVLLLCDFLSLTMSCFPMALEL